MNALSDRSLWLAHLRYCTSCPTDLCDRGLELAAAVEASLAPGETWEGVWGPQLQVRVVSEPTRPWPDERPSYHDGV